MEYRYLDGLRIEVREDIPENSIAFITPGKIRDFKVDFSRTDDNGNVIVTASVYYDVPPQIVAIQVKDAADAARDGDDGGEA